MTKSKKPVKACGVANLANKEMIEILSNIEKHLAKLSSCVAESPNRHGSKSHLVTR
jgi:hypothetical protein